MSAGLKIAITVQMLALAAGIWWFVGFVIDSIAADQARWKAFAAAHNCKVIGHISPSVQSGVGFGVTVNGTPGIVTTTSTTAGKTGYLCDDGITYWR